METIDGRQVINRTQMERLKGRKAKHRWVMEKGHWLGRKENIWFNPYTKSDQLTVKNCPAVARPRGQAGRGEFLIHEAIGLTDDYDTFLDIRVSDLLEHSDASNMILVHDSQGCTQVSPSQHPRRQEPDLDELLIDCSNLNLPLCE
jgi:hypothetical protein